MPYEIKKSGEGYKVFKKGTSKAFSKSPMTKKEAGAQLKALYANTNEDKSNTMKKSELTKMIQEIIKEVISESKSINEADMFVTGGSINPELRKKVEQFVKSIAKYYDYSVDDAFLAIMTILKGGIAKEGISESVDYDTAVAFRLVAKGNRDAALEALQTEINKVTGPMGGFSKVKVTIIPSKGNPQDIIIKLNGPSALSMGRNITAKDKTKAYINPTIRNNFVKVSPYTPQLTKIS